MTNETKTYDEASVDELMGILESVQGAIEEKKKHVIASEREFKTLKWIDNYTYELFVEIKDFNPKPMVSLYFDVDEKDVPVFEKFVSKDIENMFYIKDEVSISGRHKFSLEMYSVESYQEAQSLFNFKITKTNLNKHMMKFILWYVGHFDCKEMLK